MNKFNTLVESVLSKEEMQVDEGILNDIKNKIKSWFKPLDVKKITADSIAFDLLVKFTQDVNDHKVESNLEKKLTDLTKSEKSAVEVIRKIKSELV